MVISSAPPAQRHVCSFLEGRAAVVLRADAGDADVAAACAHALLLHRRELVRVRVACPARAPWHILQEFAHGPVCTTCKPMRMHSVEGMKGR